MKPLRLVLSPAQSAILDDHGSDHFILVHRPCRTEEPEVNRRWTITLIPCDHATAQDACLVVMGKASVRRINSTSKP